MKSHGERERMRSMSDTEERICERRRLLLALAGATLAAAAVPGTTPGGARTGAAAGPRRVCVRALSLADFEGCDLLDGAHPFWQEAARQLVAEQAALVRRLRAAGVEVVLQ